MKKIHLSKTEVLKYYQIYLETHDLTGYINKYKDTLPFKSPGLLFDYFNKYNLIYCANQVDMSIIDSEIKAYFLGLIYADGSLVSSNSYLKVVITLQEQDGYILTTIRDSLFPFANVTFYDIKHKYPNWSNRYVLSLGGQKFCENLMKIGLIRNKTTIEYSLPNIPENMYQHFIRGYFDGDGTCTIHHHNHYKHTKSGNFYNRIAIPCLTSKVLYDIKELLGIGKVRISKNRQNRQDIYHFWIEKQPEIKMFYNYIYQNATIFLQRKKDKFLHDNPVLINMLTSINSVETNS